MSEFERAEDDAAADAAILRHLLAFNERFAGPANSRSLQLLLRDSAGVVEGGLSGRTRYGWLFVENFFIPEHRRGTGLGTRLLAAAEAEAAARGCIGAYLDTNSFQAPGFYEKQGYSRFGALEDYPAPGMAKYYYRKRF
ncbi:GNAT family N-acetyltransferase [Roseomonas haemaphysalidis]|uniref:GNAT family N-acetyltransferase n=1 Tax=Roseomonas haemaphysalidis TaxID=2768162 RepID=A0ABS3KQU8_9PROT|nr:GNAT family N-acetyltransferase [Roseomonas haemaphysalidis]MBO1079846.1 GNAT family N-acetyltransferase [Roseomonas haemaphysalidis]